MYHSCTTHPRVPSYNISSYPFQYYPFRVPLPKKTHLALTFRMCIIYACVCVCVYVCLCAPVWVCMCMRYKVNTYFYVAAHIRPSKQRTNVRSAKYNPFSLSLNDWNGFHIQWVNAYMEITSTMYTFLGDIICIRIIYWIILWLLIECHNQFENVIIIIRVKKQQEKKLLENNNLYFWI